MQFKTADLTSPAIRDLRHRTEDHRCTLQWLWPDSVQAVYIHKAPSHTLGQELPDFTSLKLYTKDEYKANHGYHDRFEGIGQWTYTIYISTTLEGEAVLLVPQDGSHRLIVSTGKANIYFKVRLKSGLFQKYKTAQIQVTSEVPLAKDVLCYVKKQGGYPTNKEDGTVYPFLESFQAGKNILPPIEIGKNDYIRIFFTDGPTYGHVYALIPE